ncbi:hypothetical protein DMN91_000002 [Ooceraea biroi]|uniref:Uncharacterized protein n=1 Tax=Ooceraea biroi TaxID=2015173 RepID=A0A3L8E1Z0_OOCBI|nr:uncharacterized protein LOC105281531 [Ooceraea biroi]XP_026829333.1 uncharacterized protein LOC105281531 [Ooceraea biroi]XP_026829336.1 uncharacterized protein LOC105281531 [Ooceraea biroi]RLU26209.1 hypothetical protein DMN91_000002 [Ooceraea biroi]
MTSTYSTVVNFSTLDLLRRLSRIQVINEIVTDLGDSFTFPREKCSSKLGNTAKKDSGKLITLSEIKEILFRAKADVLSDCLELGINTTEEAFCTIYIKPDSADYFDHEDNRSESDNDSVSPNENSGFISETDLNDITESKTIFQNMDHLDLKDCSKTANNNRSVLKIKLKTGKTITVKKSTLCWFFTENRSRLFANRLDRVKGMGSQKTKKILPEMKSTFLKSRKRIKKSIKLPIKPKNKRSKLTEEEQESETETKDEQKYISECESSGGEYVAKRNSSSNSDTPKKQQIAIVEEKYYAVYYDDQWYIGRIIKIEETTCQIKFLYRNLDSFNWPKQEDVQQIKKCYIFYGPISLLGLNPFNLKRYDLCAIEKKYKMFKKDK